MARKAPPAALIIIEGYEGLGGQRGDRFYPYHCTADAPGIMTIGKGRVLSDAELKHGLKLGGFTVDVCRDGLSRDQVDQLFAETIRPRVDRLEKLMPGATDQQFAAGLSSFYNNEDMWAIGTPGKCFRAGRPRECAEALLMYIKSGKPLKPMLGLWRRRLTEALYMLTGEICIAKTPSRTAQLEAKCGAAGINWQKYKPAQLF